MGNKRKSAACGRTIDRLVRRWRSQAGYWRAGAAFLLSEGHPVDAVRERAYAETLLTCARELQEANDPVRGRDDRSVP